MKHTQKTLTPDHAKHGPNASPLTFVIKAAFIAAAVAVLIAVAFSLGHPIAPDLAPFAGP